MGWFDSWARRRRGPGDYGHVMKSLAWMLENGASFNIYLVHGGTTFGFQGGANGPPYVPQFLGREHTSTGLRYLPRQDGLPNGRIREFRVYISPTPFKGL